MVTGASTEGLDRVLSAPVASEMMAGLMAKPRNKQNKSKRRTVKSRARPENRPLKAAVPHMHTDAAANPETRRAMVQAEKLLRVIPFPLEVSAPLANPHGASLDTWELVAPAMIFSAANCLLSIRYLAEANAPRREQDASVLLRRLYEHVVDFAWVCISPAEHSKLWTAKDLRSRITIDDELRRLGHSGLEQQVRQNFDNYARAIGKPPDLASRAIKADEHWSRVIPEHGTFPANPESNGSNKPFAQGGYWSLRSLYVVIYRSASANAHPTPLSLNTFIHPSDIPGKFKVGFNAKDQRDRFPYTHAPLIYAMMLLVAERVLGYPSSRDIYAAFATERMAGK